MHAGISSWVSAPRTNEDSGFRRAGCHSRFGDAKKHPAALSGSGRPVRPRAVSPERDGINAVHDPGQGHIVTDGPFAETRELIAGYTIIQVDSRDEAVRWAGRFPNPAPGDGCIEVRRMCELEDFEDLEGIDRFREIGVSTRQG